MSPTRPSSVGRLVRHRRVRDSRRRCAGFEAKARTRWPRAASLSIAARQRGASIFSSPDRSGLRRAELEHALGRALDADERARAGGVQGRHEPISGIEGDLLEPRRLALHGLGVHAGLHREGDQRALHRIAVDDPVASRLSNEASLQRRDARAIAARSG